MYKKQYTLEMLEKVLYGAWHLQVVPFRGGHNMERITRTMEKILVISVKVAELSVKKKPD